MSGFDKFLATALDEAGGEARKDGSSTLEAHHLLLAVARSEEPSTRELLGSVGLDYAAIRAALDREFTHSLGAAGISLAVEDFPRSSHARDGAPQLGSSVRNALQRGIGDAGRRKDLRPAHLLLGIVQAPVGTVPRALELAGVDRQAFARRIRQVTTDGS